MCSALLQRRKSHPYRVVVKRADTDELQSCCFIRGQSKDAFIMHTDAVVVSQC